MYSERTRIFEVFVNPFTRDWPTGNHWNLVTTPAKPGSYQLPSDRRTTKVGRGFLRPSIIHIQYIRKNGVRNNVKRNNNCIRNCFWNTDYFMVLFFVEDRKRRQEKRFAKKWEKMIFWHIVKSKKIRSKANGKER